MSYDPKFDLTRPMPGDDLRDLRAALERGKKLAEARPTIDCCGHCGATGDFLTNNPGGPKRCRHCGGE